MAKIARRTSDRFEIEQDGQTSYLAYEADGQGWLSLLYTEVAEPLRGRGIAKDLAQMAFEYAKENHLKVEVVCPVALHFALSHPEYKSLIGIRHK
jgi:predicted GNAT family acetyltransferase